MIQSEVVKGHFFLLHRETRKQRKRLWYLKYWYSETKHKMRLCNNTGVPGTQNICFLNASLQALKSLDIFKEFFTRRDYDSENQQFPICDEIQKLFSQNSENVQSSPVSITGTGFMRLVFWDAKIPLKIKMRKAACVFMFNAMFLWPKFVHNWWHVDVLVSLPGYVIWLVTSTFGEFCHEMWSIFLQL